MRSLLLVVVLLGVSAALADSQVSWYHANGLSNAAIHRLTEAGCYRGSFGGQSTALLTCAPSGDATPFAVLDDAVPLCVLELTDSASLLGSAVGAELSRLLAAASDAAVLPLADAGLVVLAGSADGEASELCFAGNFGPLVTNRIFVPRQAVAPQRAMPVDHPALRKTILRPEASAFSVSPAITSYLSTFNKEEVSMYLARVSTDYQGENSLITRNSYAIRYGVGGCANSTWRCANNVVDWVIAEASRLMADYPHEWQIEELPFNDDMCSNIRLTIPGELYPEQIVAIGAHLDSRNTGSGRAATGPAPGADDNGSGTAVNLEIVRSIAANERKYKFAYTVHILWFCGEEQGLVGSNAMAQQYKKDGAEIIAYFNNDMIAYTDPRFGVRLSFMTRFSTLWLTNVCKETAAVYVPSLPSGDTTACCSDQQSFFQAGFPAAGIFETPTSGVSYPQYHKSGDTYNNGLINYDQVYLFGQANFACILEFAAPLEDLD